MIRFICKIKKTFYIFVNPVKEKYWYAFNTITYDKPIKTN